MFKVFMRAVLLGTVLVLPVHAEGTFQIIGGIGDGGNGGGWSSGTQVAGATIYGNPAPGQLEKKIVPFTRNMPPGSILVNTSERKLYLVLPGGEAAMYPIGVGREGFTWTGTNHITRKAEWPGWTPPERMRARVLREEGRKLPAYVPGGKNNPLGARAMYIGSRIYRIHGTNQPWTLGQAMSSGCIRMANEDVINLYEQAPVGTKVIVRQ